MPWAIALDKDLLKGMLPHPPSPTPHSPLPLPSPSPPSSLKTSHPPTFPLTYPHTNHRFSANTPRPTTPLDMIKFICKDLWQLVFRKQIDNLKTNHRGTFVLTDNKFMALGRMSADTRRGPRGGDEALGKAQPVSECLCFPFFKSVGLSYALSELFFVEGVGR